MICFAITAHIFLHETNIEKVSQKAIFAKKFVIRIWDNKVKNNYKPIETYRGILKFFSKKIIWISEKCPKKEKPLNSQWLFKSGWQDSNLRPPHPKCGAIPGYATPRKGITFVLCGTNIRGFLFLSRLFYKIFITSSFIDF